MKGSRWKRPAIKNLKSGRTSEQGANYPAAAADGKMERRDLRFCGFGWLLRWVGAKGLEGLEFEGVEGACSGEARADSPEWLCSCHSKGENLNERVEE